MNIADLIGLYDEGQHGAVAMGNVVELCDWLGAVSAEARGIILQRMVEEDYVKVRSLIKRTVLAIMMSNDEDGARALVALDILDSESVNGLLDTCMLAMLGLMMQEEIL